MTRISYVKHIFEIYQTYTKVVSYVWYMSAMSHTLVYLRDIPCISNFYRFQMEPSRPTDERFGLRPAQALPVSRAGDTD